MLDFSVLENAESKLNYNPSKQCKLMRTVPSVFNVNTTIKGVLA